MPPSALRTLSCLTTSASTRNLCVGLDVDLPGAAEAVEVVDVVAAQVHLERVEHVGQGHAHRPDLGPVHLRVELRRPARKPSNRPTRPARRLPSAARASAPRLERVEVHVARRLHHQLEAARVAEARHRRRAEHEDAGLLDLLPEPLAQPARDGLAGQRRVAPLVERLEDEEHGAVVRAEGVQDERLPRYADRAGDARASRGRSSRPPPSPRASARATPSRAVGC